MKAWAYPEEQVFGEKIEFKNINMSAVKNRKDLIFFFCLCPKNRIAVRRLIKPKIAGWITITYTIKQGTLIGFVLIRQGIIYLVTLYCGVHNKTVKFVFAVFSCKSKILSTGLLSSLIASPNQRPPSQCYFMWELIVAAFEITGAHRTAGCGRVGISYHIAGIGHRFHKLRARRQGLCSYLCYRIPFALSRLYRSVARCKIFFKKIQIRCSVPMFHHLV